MGQKSYSFFPMGGGAGQQDENLPRTLARFSVTYRVLPRFSVCAPQPRRQAPTANEKQVRTMFPTLSVASALCWCVGFGPPPLLQHASLNRMKQKKLTMSAFGSPCPLIAFKRTWRRPLCGHGGDSADMAATQGGRGPWGSLDNYCHVTVFATHEHRGTTHVIHNFFFFAKTTTNP